MVLVELLLNGSLFHGYMCEPFVWWKQERGELFQSWHCFSQTLHQLIYFPNYVPSWLSPNLIIHGTEVGTVGGLQVWCD